mmetsp:Transcript_12321/g.21615  ORF Transcript_12321/g.21615 Transcript_12321/m.21615 type:complete len:135 (+) Transcript_12321:1-405(+)
MNLGFGVSRFDDQLVAIYSSHRYTNKYATVRAYLYFLLGGLLKDISNGTHADDDVQRKEIVAAGMNKRNQYIQQQQQQQYLKYGLCYFKGNKFVAKGCGPYRLYFDGSDKAPLEGSEITFEVLPEAISYHIASK